MARTGDKRTGIVLLACTVLACSSPAAPATSNGLGTLSGWGGGFDGGQGGTDLEPEAEADASFGGEDDVGQDPNAGSGADAGPSNDAGPSKDAGPVADGGAGPDSASLLDAAEADAAGATTDATTDATMKDAGKNADAKSEPLTSELDAGPPIELDAGGVTDAGPAVAALETKSVKVSATAMGPAKVDIVFFVDTSGSMSAEAGWVSKNLISFSKWLQGQNLDPHVVLIGKTSGSVKLCIDPPMSNGPCGTKGPNFLQVLQYVNSNDGLKQVLNTYPQYAGFLRPDAAKNLVAVTDDNANLSAAQFTQSLNALQNPGFGKDWKFHTIGSFVDPDPNKPQPAQGCNTGASLSKIYLQLTQQTGGAAFQVCAKDWNPVFDQLAKSVLASVKPVCAYGIPWPYAPDVAKMPKVLHTEPEGIIEALQYIPNEAACATTPNGWYADDPLKPMVLQLCQKTCDAMKGGFLVFQFPF